jgi:hypothetical protein
MAINMKKRGDKRKLCSPALTKKVAARHSTEKAKLKPTKNPVRKGPTLCHTLFPVLLLLVFLFFSDILCVLFFLQRKRFGGLTKQPAKKAAKPTPTKPAKTVAKTSKKGTLVVVSEQIFFLSFYVGLVMIVFVCVFCGGWLGWISFFFTIRSPRAGACSRFDSPRQDSGQARQETGQKIPQQVTGRVARRAEQGKPAIGRGASTTRRAVETCVGWVLFFVFLVSHPGIKVFCKYMIGILSGNA